MSFFCDVAALWDETVARFVSGWSSENEGIPGNPAGIYRKVQKRRSGCLRKNLGSDANFFLTMLCLETKSDEENLLIFQATS